MVALWLLQDNYQPNLKSEDASYEEQRFPGSLPLATTTVRSTSIHGDHRCLKLRSPLSPAHFVLVPDTSPDFSIVPLVRPEVGHGAHPKEAWRELSRLFELKHIFGGWDFQIAMVRRH
ncbi:hypothetical protein PTI98_008104 [Pleurotus ostreatus]|nr:hypothetical protein PTI98_008104 [Pleurotus ostreatus]